jgi:hypothetical protein
MTLFLPARVRSSSEELSSVLGSGDYLLNPAAAACPVCGTIVQLHSFCR